MKRSLKTRNKDVIRGRRNAMCGQTIRMQQMGQFSEHLEGFHKY